MCTDMLRDFDLIVHAFPELDHMKIYPIADVHLGAIECMEQEFMAFLKAIEEDPYAYVVLCGDLLNNGVKNSVTNIYEETRMPSQAKKLMAELLKPISSKVLAAVSGNHERRSSREVDDDITYDIMSKCDIEHLYRPNMAFIKIQMGEKRDKRGFETRGRDRPTYQLVLTHGAAGGAMTGAGINRNERFGYAIDNMDALITAHTHRPAVTKPSKIVIDPHNNLVKLRPFYVVTATSWLSTGGYALQKMLTPTSYVEQTLYLSGKRKEMEVRMK